MPDGDHIRRSVNLAEAKADLARLVEAAARGEGFVIAEGGRPLVKVVPVKPADSVPRPLADVSKRVGFAEGRYSIPDDFDEMFADEIAESFGLPR